MQGDEIKAAQSAFSLPDPRELNPLQMAYLGDTLHDLYVTKQTDRLDTLIRLAILRTEDIWHKQS